MSDPRCLYWDASCFICFLNDQESERRAICQDILNNARNGHVEIWTSELTRVEVVRPKGSKPPIPPLPDWANKAIKEDPKCKGHIEHLWEYFHNHTIPSRKLTAEETDMIDGMFEWPWLNKILLDDRI